MKNNNSISKKAVGIMNPLVGIVLALLFLIIILAIFRTASPMLTFGFGMNAHLGDLKGRFRIEAFDNMNEGPIFAMFFAEWCGHCKRAKPEFKKLMDSYNGKVKVMLIDAEAAENKDLVQSQNVKGFPTIRYYPNGFSSKPVEYEGGRDFKSFMNYLNSLQGTM